MAFWRAEFAPLTSGEKFEKQYAYNVRHNYGKEGNRKSYTPYSCLKIISAIPGVVRRECRVQSKGLHDLQASILSRQPLQQCSAVLKVIHEKRIGSTLSTPWGCAPSCHSKVRRGGVQQDCSVSLALCSLEKYSCWQTAETAQSVLMLDGRHLQVCHLSILRILEVVIGDGRSTAAQSPGTFYDVDFQVGTMKMSWNRVSKSSAMNELGSKIGIDLFP